MLTNYTIKTRLTVGLSLLVVVLLGIISFVNFRVLSLENSFQEYNDVAVAGQKYTLMISRDMNYVSRLTRSIMLNDSYKKNLDKMQTRIANIESHFKNLKSAGGLLPEGDTKNQLLTAIDQSLNDTMAFLSDGRTRMKNLGSVERTPEVLTQAWNDYRKAASPLANKARGSFKKLIGITDDFMQRSLSQNVGLLSNTAAGTTSAGVIVFIAILAMAFFLIQSVVRPLTKLQNSIHSIQVQSDLTRRVEKKGKDEISAVAASFNEMLESFQTLIKDAQNSSSGLSRGMEKSASITTSTTEGAQAQHNDVAQLATAINEMTSTVQEVAANATHTSNSAREADTETAQGKEVVNQTIAAINELAAEVEQASEVIHTLENDSEKIGSVLDVIKGIAEQTNLLALNAAIEAARAGEHGRGFAVVADEVRTLATRTQQSTQEIQEVIEKLQSGAKDAVTVMERSRTKADTGVEHASKAGDSLQTIMQSVDTISEMNMQIASASSEQSTVAEEINKNIVNISDIADRTATDAKENSAAIESMRSQAESLNQQLNKFKV